jgi:hypothetical protein
MTVRNLFIFMVDSVRQLGGDGRGVIIVRKTPLEELVKMFDAFLLEEEIAKHFKYKKETSKDHPDMVIYRVEGKDEHIVIGTNEQGWKGDYGLTHTDIVTSIH